MEQQRTYTFFCGEIIPAYERKEVLNILKYYAKFDAALQFYTFEEIDRSRMDIDKIAKQIWEDIGQCHKTEYVNTLLDSVDANMLSLFFKKKLYFVRQLDF